MTKPRATPGTPPTGGGAAPRDFQDHLRVSPSPSSPPLAQTLKDLGDVNDERVVLLPVDGGRGIETDAVLKWCCDNLYRDGDTFLLLHVVPRSGWRRRAREDALGYEPSEANAADDEAAAVWLDEAEARMRREYLPRLLEFGLPEDVACFEVAAYDTACAKVGELVCEVAAATNAACVAMARHGKGTLRELVTGSVTNYCVHHCGSPVVVINVAAELSAREAAVGDRECAEFAWVP